jgi:RNA polymerase sigma-70 factor (ECF subfamily)
MTPLVSRAVRKARAGDRDALLFLYARYADDVYDYVRTIVSDRDEAQAITRCVFVGLEGMIDRYEEQSAPFSVWLRRAAHGIPAENACR